MSIPAFERTYIQQIQSIEQYADQIIEMDKRTIIQYDDRWNVLLKKHSEGVFLSESIPATISGLISSFKNLQIKPSTFRVYRAAACYGLATTYMQIEDEVIADVELENGLNLQILSNLFKELVLVKLDTSDKNQTYTEKTSALKKKSFPQGFYNYLVNLSKNKKLTPRCKLLINFVQANMLVGLRPIEWLNARLAFGIADKRMVLIVENAKNSHGRANGDKRILLLGGLDLEDQYKINHFYSRFQKRLHLQAKTFLIEHQAFKNDEEYEQKSNRLFSKIWKDFEPTAYRNIPKSDLSDALGNPKQGLAEIVLRGLQREMYIQFDNYMHENPGLVLDQKRVTLYSTRHQCIANAKANKTNIFEIAAFFGHSSTETSSRHYGKAWSGWSSFVVKPDPHCILEVRNSADYVEQEYGIVVEQNNFAKNMENTIELNGLDLDF